MPTPAVAPPVEVTNAREGTGLVTPTKADEVPAPPVEISTVEPREIHKEPSVTEEAPAEEQELSGEGPVADPVEKLAEDPYEMSPPQEQTGVRTQRGDEGGYTSVLPTEQCPQTCTKGEKPGDKVEQLEQTTLSITPVPEEAGEVNPAMQVRESADLCQIVIRSPESFGPVE